MALGLRARTAALLAVLGPAAAGCLVGRPVGRPEGVSEPAAASAEPTLTSAERAAAAYSAGLEAEMAGDRETAVECYRRAVEALPDSGRCQARLGLALAALERHQEAAGHLERAGALGRSSLALHGALAGIHLKAGDRQRAAAEYEKVLSCPELAERGPRTDEAALRVALFLVTYYQAAQQPADAARVYGALAARFPDRPEFRLDRAKLLLAAGDEAAARSELDLYRRLRPDSHEPSWALAVYLKGRGRCAQALAEAERALAAMRASGGPPPADAVTMRYFRADMLRRLDRRSQARQELESLLAEAASDGARVDAVVELVYLDREAGLAESAARRAQAAIDSGLASARLQAALAGALEDGGRLDGAAAAWRRAVELAPDDLDHRLSLARLLERAGRRAEAAAELRAALVRKPGDPACSDALARLYALEGINLDEAGRLADRALAAAPENGRYLETLGWVRYRQGRAREALELLERAALREPGEAGIHERLGDACYALGLLRRARAAWTRSLELDKGRPGPDYKLKRLGGRR